MAKQWDWSQSISGDGVMVTVVDDVEDENVGEENGE